MRAIRFRRRTDVEWIERDVALDNSAVRERLLPARVVLDIGPGIYPQTLVDAQVTICVEPYAPYIRKLQERFAGDPGFVLLNATWSRALSLLPDSSVDTVTALDVIEHVQRRQGLRLLAEAERVARTQIVVFTPLGFYQQSYSSGDKDRWGFEGGFWQTHRSGWKPGDFDSCWEIVACRDFHQVDEHEQPLAKPFGAFWAIKTLGSRRRRR